MVTSRAFFSFQPRIADERVGYFTTVRQDDPEYKWDKREQDPGKWFRPSDVAVGHDLHPVPMAVEIGMTDESKSGCVPVQRAGPSLPPAPAGGDALGPEVVRQEGAQAATERIRDLGPVGACPAGADKGHRRFLGEQCQRVGVAAAEEHRRWVRKLVDQRRIVRRMGARDEDPRVSAADVARLKAAHNGEMLVSAVSAADSTRRSRRAMPR